MNLAPLDTAALVLPVRSRSLAARPAWLGALSLTACASAMASPPAPVAPPAAPVSTPASDDAPISAAVAPAAGLAPEVCGTAPVEALAFAPSGTALWVACGSGLARVLLSDGAVDVRIEGDLAVATEALVAVDDDTVFVFGTSLVRVRLQPTARGLGPTPSDAIAVEALAGLDPGSSDATSAALAPAPGPWLLDPATGRVVRVSTDRRIEVDLGGRGRAPRARALLDLPIGRLEIDLATGRERLLSTRDPIGGSAPTSSAPDLVGAPEGARVISNGEAVWADAGGVVRHTARVGPDGITVVDAATGAAEPLPRASVVATAEDTAAWLRAWPSATAGARWTVTTWPEADGPTRGIAREGGAIDCHLSGESALELRCDDPAHGDRGTAADFPHLLDLVVGAGRVTVSFLDGGRAVATGGWPRAPHAELSARAALVGGDPELTRVERFSRDRDRWCLDVGTRSLDPNDAGLTLHDRVCLGARGLASLEHTEHVRGEAMGAPRRESAPVMRWELSFGAKAPAR